MKIPILALSLLLASGITIAQPAPHSAVLTWTASADAASNPTLTYNVYRVNGSCPAVAPTSVSGSGFAVLNTSPVTTTTFTDATIQPGVYCYFVTAALAGAESIPSNTTQALLLPAQPTSLGVTSIK